jgi:cytochrome P450
VGARRGMIPLGPKPADIHALCNDLLDGIGTKGGNTFDVVDYAYPVPVAVIFKILGVPLKDEPTFHGWIFDVMAGAEMGPDAKTRGRPSPSGEGS